VIAWMRKGPDLLRRVPPEGGSYTGDLRG
jgi:hypothetical protein